MVVFGPFLLLLTPIYLQAAALKHAKMQISLSKQTPTNNVKAIGHMGTLIKSRSTPVIIGFSCMYE